MINNISVFLDIPQYSFYFMLFILSLLVVATAIQVILGLKKPNLELRQRITSWWWIIGLLFLVFSIGTNTAIIFFGFISFLALKEFLSIVHIRQSDRSAIFWAYLAIPLQYYWVTIGWYGLFIIFIPVYLFLFLPLRMVLKGDTDGFIKSAGILQWAVMLNVFAISHIAFLLILPEKNAMAGNIGLVLFLLFMTQFNDVSQYVWGKTLGRHKILPKVSPNKTWEGFIGGLITITLAAGFIAPYLTPMTMQQGFVAGLLISASGFIGDVVISSVKRDLQIKDCGNLLPGHGGILDRIDSLIYTSPLFFHYIYYLYY